MVQMFMRDLIKVSALWSVCFRVSALERFCYKGFLRNSSGTKFFVRLREMSALEDVSFREVPLYKDMIWWSWRGGGVTCFGKNSISYNRKPNFCVNTRSIFVEVLLSKSKPVLIGILCRRPYKYDFLKLSRTNIQRN